MPFVAGIDRAVLQFEFEWRFYGLSLVIDLRPFSGREHTVI